MGACAGGTFVVAGIRVWFLKGVSGIIRGSEYVVRNRIVGLCAGTVEFALLRW